MIDTSPHNTLECAILSSCLLEDEAVLERFAAAIRPEHFTLSSHQTIYRTILAMHKRGAVVNIVTLGQELGALGRLAEIGGFSYLADLDGAGGRLWAKTEKGAAEFIARLKEAWRIREMWRLGEEMALQAQEPDATASGMVAAATTRLEAIVCDAEVDDADVSNSIVGFLDRFFERRTLDRSPGLSYGIPELDRQTGGMMPGETTAVGASSGIGKTAFMAQAIFATLSAGYPVDAFLLEPTKDQILARLTSLLTGVRYNHVIRPWLANMRAEEAVKRGASQIAEMPLRMYARSSMTLDDVLGQARIGMRKRGTRLICTDYIQRLKIRQAEKDEPVRLRVGRASTALADLVKDSQTHSMLLSQINTGRRSGAMAAPTMFDFRESSQIENDAHTIILLHREFDEAQGHYTNQGAIFVPKQRNGVPCNVRAWFDGVTAAWRDTDPATQPQDWRDAAYA